MSKNQDSNNPNHVQKIWSNLEKKFIPPYAWDSDILTLWRERIIFFIYFFAAIAGPFALVPSLILSFNEGLWAVIILDAIVYSTVLIVLFSNNISLNIRTWITFIIFYILGIGLLLLLGFYGAGYIWLFGASLIVGTMIGYKAAFFALLTNLLGLSLIGIFIAFGTPPWISTVENALAKWLVMTVNFMLLNTMITLLVAAMLKSLEDALTREMNTASELKEKQEEILSIFKANPDPIIVYDKNNSIKYVNDAFTKTFGWTFDELKMSNFIYVPDHQNKISFDTYLNIPEIEKKDTIRFETKRITKNGSILNVILSASPIIGDNSEAIGLVMNMKDITESKKLEKQLQQAQKMESIGTLAGGIAHDFNNILLTIFGYLEMAKDEIDENNPAYSDIEYAFDGAKRARDLVKQILTFSRQSDHELKPLKTQLIIKEALKLLRSSIPTTISITQNICNDCGLIMADPTHIHQIIMNLCTNAFHAMEISGGKLRVELEELFISEKDAIDQDMKPDNYICLTVADTGHGMKQEVLDRIFEPFYTTKEKGKGTGLGLSVIHGIVSDYNGYINIESKIGVGTEFKIYFPVIEHANIKTEEKQDIPLLKGKEHILLVDDETLILQLQRKLLEQLGYRVAVQNNSVSALELFKSNPEKFDLIITDMTMPDMTGDVLAEKVIEIRKDIPIIMCTGYNEHISEEDAIKKGIRGFLLKPFEINKLSQKIRDVLDSTLG